MLLKIIKDIPQGFQAVGHDVPAWPVGEVVGVRDGIGEALRRAGLAVHHDPSVGAAPEPKPAAEPAGEATPEPAHRLEAVILEEMAAMQKEGDGITRGRPDVATLSARVSARMGAEVTVTRNQRDALWPQVDIPA